MNYNRYDLISEDDFTVFELTSIGLKGSIVKRIQYSKTEIEDFYNLAFGDKNLITGDFDDTITSNNGDTEKVIMTVASTVYFFTLQYPDAIIYVTGSTTSRTRLYQIGIAKFIEEIQSDFEIYSEKNEEWKPFTKGENYDAFLLKRKQISLMDEKE